jgi:hypothetical protein
MDFKQSIQSSLRLGDFLVQQYLGDITAAEMLVRPVPGANHAAWQLGHLILSEHRLVEAAKKGSMPALPEGFAERHTTETAALNDPAAFYSKDEYLKIGKQVRAGTLAVLDSLSDADVDKAAPAKLPPMIQCVGDCFVLIGGHWSTHAGQWVVLRRKLGRPRQF